MDKNKIKPESKSYSFKRILRLEIEDSITSHIIKIIRFLGILFIPFLYGFIYIFAFNKPLSKTNQLDIAMILPSHGQSDLVIEKVIDKLDENQGDTLNIKAMKMDATDIYGETKNFKEEIDKHFATITLNPLSDAQGKPMTLKSWFASQMLNILKFLPKKDIQGAAITLLTELIKATKDNGILKFYFNNKKNFLIGFGSAFKISTHFVYSKPVEAFLSIGNAGIKKLIPLAVSLTNFDAIIDKALQLAKNIEKSSIIKLNSQMKEHAQYGFGLSPFFISLGLWVGAIAATLFINGKVYRKKEDKTILYFTKLFIVLMANVIQTTILFLSLTAIGFYKLGPPFGLMYFSSLIISFLLTSIVFSIRFMIPSRVAGIIIVVFFLILQMSVSGGLFPNFAQSSFAKGLSYLMPIKWTVALLRGVMYESVAGEWFKNVTILFLLSSTFQVAGPLIYTYRKNIQFPLVKEVA